MSTEIPAISGKLKIQNYFNYRLFTVFLQGFTYTGKFLIFYNIFLLLQLQEYFIFFMIFSVYGIQIR